MNDDSDTTLDDVKRRLLAFSRERGWEPFHTPKDLGIALACETGELLEHFRFRDDARIAQALADPAERKAIADEVADCLWALVRLADVAGIDLATSLEAKLADAAVKYPIEKAYGRADKYTNYRPEKD